MKQLAFLLLHLGIFCAQISCHSVCPNQLSFRPTSIYPPSLVATMCRLWWLRGMRETMLVDCKSLLQQWRGSTHPTNQLINRLSEVQLTDVDFLIPKSRPIGSLGSLRNPPDPLAPWATLLLSEHTPQWPTLSRPFSLARSLA
jgi:hypothetical protein